MKYQNILSAAFFLITLLLVACGEDGTTEKVTQVMQEGVQIVSELDDLPKCTKDNDGELMFVKGETSMRICSGGKWYATIEATSKSSCTTKALKDKSGVKIICDGDSVGVVLNGKDGAQGIQGEQGVPGEKGDVGAAGKDGEGCSVVTLADNFGLKVLCGGDSVGVVLNGTDGKDGSDGADGTNGTDGTNGKDGVDGKDGAGCSMEKVENVLVRVICGKDTAVVWEAELIDTTAVAIDSEKIAISLDTVSGVSQKGPFLKGSKVTVREMSDGRTLAQTGNTFEGKIMNDNGEFKIKARMLVSQYVMLIVNGYYRNEVTGENSGSDITLFAITNVNDRNIVNVNLLTHLEYDRVIHLVTKEKMKVQVAKRQAQQEVLDMFHIDSKDFSNSEDLDIAGSSDEDGALLAFSIMFQGDRSSGVLLDLLQTVSTDIETDGVWDDAATRMDMAEWSADADSSGRLETIRTNVANWGLSLMVPNFEKYIRHFWYTEYGLDSCNADSAGVVKAASAGKRKGTKTRYICKEIGEDSGDYRWVIASDIEKDTYGWKDSTDGALKVGNVNNYAYVFDSTGSFNGVSGWRAAQGVETFYGGCKKALYNEIRRDTKNGGFYRCLESKHLWEIEKNTLLIDTQLWTDSDDGFSQWGDSIGVVTSDNRICYVYDTSVVYRGWRVGNINDCTLGLLGCTAGRAGRMLPTKDKDYYNCANNSWTLVEGRVAPNTMGWACLDSNDGKMRLGQVNDAYFVCDGNAWRESAPEEERNCRKNGMCSICTGKRQGDFETRNGYAFVCDSQEWRYANCAEIKTQSLCTANDSAIVWECEGVGRNAIDYVCSNDSWHAVEMPYDYTLEDWNIKREKYYTQEMNPNVVYGDDFEDPRDNNVYKTIVINGKRLFAENLRYGNSAEMINLKNNNACYNGMERNCAIAGRLYTWTAALNLDSKWQNGDADFLIESQHQGACPSGWHVPTADELRSVVECSDCGESRYLEMSMFTGWGASDILGFSAVPVNFINGFFDCDGIDTTEPYASFWTTTQLSVDMAQSLDDFRGSSVFSYEYYDCSVGVGQVYAFSQKLNMNSVRCFENQPE